MKRAADGPTDASSHGAPPKRAHSRVVREGKFTYKVLCPEPLVSAVVGGGGAVIRHIQEETNGHLTFSQRGDFYPNTRLRVLLVSAGSAGALVNALNLVLEHATNCGDEERQVLDGTGSLGDDQGEFVDAMGDYRLRCCVPTSAGNALGNEGLQYLQEESQARIAVDVQEFELHQLITVDGTRPQILAALQKLTELVNAEVDEPWFQEWAEHRCFGVVPDTEVAPKQECFGTTPPSKFNRPPPPPRREQAGKGGGKRGADTDCTVFVGGLTQWVDAKALRSHFGEYGAITAADVKKDQRTGRSKGFGFVAFASSAMVEQCLRRTDDHVIDGKWVEVKRYGAGDSPDGASERLITNDGEERGRKERSLKGSWKDNHQGGKNQNDWKDDAGTYPHADRGRHAGNGRDQKRSPSRDGENRRKDEEPSDDIRWFADVAETVPKEFRELHYCITCKMPEHACGALIGRRGGNIANINQKTGAKVKVSSKDESQDGHRELSIIGNLCSVYAAHMLLMRTYNENENELAQAETKASAAEVLPQNQMKQIEDLKRQIDELKQQTSQQTRSHGKGRK